MKCASCGCRLSPDELTYLDGRFCEPCTIEQDALFDPIKDTWASILYAMKTVQWGKKNAV